jgi:BolA family transcriptional regulator, general stress-responsive regulator
MSNRIDRIRTSLTSAFAPLSLEIEDQSARHAGHAGVRAMARGPHGAGETHYAVTMVAAAFAGQNRVARSRAVHDALEAEFASGLHALSLVLKAPGE